VPDRSDRPAPTDDALRDELVRTRRDLVRVREELARVERERDRLRRENERLKDDLEAARRAGARQAAPFSKGAPTSHPKRPGRKSGAAHGRHGQRPVPPRLDETHDAPLPPACPHCGGTVHETRVADQYQEDLPPFARSCAASASTSVAARSVTVGSKAVIRGKRPTPSAWQPSNWGRTRSRSP
jgi:hypothetical protein